MMDTQRLKESFARIAGQKEAFAEAFYSGLQTRYPQVQPFFVDVDMQRQQTSLIATLAALVRGAELDEDLAPLFRKIGVLHARRGIRPEHYPAFGSLLLETLARFDPAWTREDRDSWAQALDRCVRGMMESYEPGATTYRVQVERARRPR